MDDAVPKDIARELEILRMSYLLVAFAAMMALAVYVILDMEFPRFGLIRADAFDQAWIEVRASTQ